MTLERCYRSKCKGQVVAQLVLVRARGADTPAMEVPVCKKHADLARSKGQTVRYVTDTGTL